MVEKTSSLVARSWRGLLLLTAVVCLQLHAATLIVDPAGGTGVFTTIQAAITAANPAGGDTVQVHAATYTEQITINKTLTLVGTAGSATTIIQAPDTTTPDPIIGEGSIVVVNNAAIVSMSGFTVQGPGGSVLCSVSNGVAVYGDATLTFDNNHVTHIRDITINNMGGCGMAIRAGFPSQTGHLIVSNTQVDDYQKNGIVVFGAGSTGTISNSTVTELLPQTVIAQNGIVIYPGATATLTSNTVSGNQYTGPGSGSDPLTTTQAAGIVAFGSTTMSNNIVHNNDIGIASASSFSTSSGDMVSGNNWEDILGLAGTLSLTADTVGDGTSTLAIAAVAFVGDTADATVLVDCLSSITGPQQALVEAGAVTKSSIVVGTCGIKTAAGQLTAGSEVTYTIVLNNSGTVDLADDPSSDEFSDVLPPALTLVSAISTSGTLATSGNTVTWNGAITAGANVTITITATLSAAAVPGDTVSNQGTIHTDVNGTPTTRTTGAAAGEDGSTDFTVAQPTPVRLQSFYVE